MLGLPSIFNIIMRSRLAQKQALKFDRYYAKPSTNKSSTDSIFRTHTLAQSQAEILFPSTFDMKRSEDQIVEIKVGKCTFYAEISEASFLDKNIKEVSILHNLICIMGVALNSAGTFKGDMKVMNKEDLPKDYHLEYVEILVKNMYLSRRDQYKVLKNLSERIVHVYNRKALFFDKLQLEVTNLLHQDDEARKMGVLTKDTKIIFRSGCAKYTILIEISKEMFELNEEKQLYLEKAIHFLLVFFQRNNYFNNKHRIEIVLFARLFYPQFTTLAHAYQALMSTNENSNTAFTINHASALQKDYKGRIFQDVYRRILWPTGSTSGFRQQFWERVSEFMFTSNWAETKTYARNINKSVEENIEKDILLNKSSKKVFKVKPFLHRLHSQVSCSEESCFFEAISLIAEQYKHHYYFRSLEETGNAITVVSAGKSLYTVDETTYKMAKSNVYLTNISCLQINLKRREPSISVKIACMKQKPRFQKEDIDKLKNLVDWCEEEEAYLSPTNLLLDFSEDFELKSVIFPNRLIEMGEQEMNKRFEHECPKKKHYTYKEVPFEEVQIEKWKEKQIEWISTYYMNEKAYQIHKILYDNFNFDLKMSSKSKNTHFEESEFATFERDLQILVNRKINYDMRELTRNSLVANKVCFYVKKMVLDNLEAVRYHSKNHSSGSPTNGSPTTSPPKIEKMDEKYYQESIISKLHSLTNEDTTGQEEQNRKKRRLICASNTPERLFLNTFESMPPDFSSPRRKVSDEIEMERSYDISRPKNVMIKKKKQRSHNKQRLRKNYSNSSIHYMMTYFNEVGLQWLQKFIGGPEPKNQQQKRIKEYLQLEKEWKSIIFPILTPIYTSYRAKRQDMEINLERLNSTPSAVEDEVCRNLMENFQIETEKLSHEITMSKGHVHMELKIPSPTAVAVFEYIDEIRQKNIIPKMIYRYLCYDEKDYRFRSKSVIFTDQNYYNKTGKVQEKKSLKLVMLEESIKGDGSCFKQFLKLLSQKYRVFKFDLQILDGAKRVSSSQEINGKEASSKDIRASNRKDSQNVPEDTIKYQINLAEGRKNKIYTNEMIDVVIDTTYNPSKLFQVYVEWNYCCATFLQEFIENVISAARKAKIITYQMSRTNAFDTRWSISTIGEIVFNSRTALEILETDINNNRQWLHDSDYYMDRNGQAFIRFIPNKNLIEWRDNLMDKSKWKKMDGENRFYEKFFMKAAAYDFIGGIIDSLANPTPSRKGSLALST